MSLRYLSGAATAKLVRGALKIAFPRTTFAVRTTAYSGGASIDVRWTDGPTIQEVDAITSAYQGASFDGMTDLMSYHTSQVNGETVHFGADFIFCHRTHSPRVG